MINRKAHILVVDDAPLIRGIIVQVLKKYGYLVEAAENGQQAIECFIEHPPDLILMDADMPVVDGVTACARIRHLSPLKCLPIIMVTSFGGPEWVDRAYAAGATDYVVKPINWDVLRNRIHYILQAKQAEEALFREKEKAQITLTSIGEGVITTNPQGEIEYLNTAASKFTGWSSKQAQGLPLHQVFSIIDEQTQKPLEFPLHRCLQEGKIVGLEKNIVLVHRDKKTKFAIKETASPIKDSQGNIIGVVLVFHDVTENLRMTQELAYKAKHDALTGLYNRQEFHIRLKSLLQMPRDVMTHHVLFYMDLDQFKIVNDTCGHEAGDQLLKTVAFILKKKIDEHASDQSTLARLGGDEFGLLLENCTLKKALSVAEHLCQSIEEIKFFWESPERSIFSIGISIGIVVLSNQLISSESLLARADAACYAAKKAGRHGVHIYQERDHQLSKQQEIQWVSLIHHNLEKGLGFSLLYQTIIPLQEHLGEKRCYEILLRLDNQEGEPTPPGAFLSTAVRYKLMPSLDFQVIRTLLDWFNAHDSHLMELTFCTVNVSGHSLTDPNFLEATRQCLEQVPQVAHKLCFEISESTALTRFTEVLYFMTTFKSLGCRFALDNFGTGLASFSFIKNLPINFLKIDGCLIKNLVNNPVHELMIKSINEFAHLMKLQTIAEHVENQLVLDKVRELKVDYAQGYWMAQPQLLCSQ